MSNSRNGWLIENQLLAAPDSSALWNRFGSPWLDSCFRRRPLVEALWFGLPDPITPPTSPPFHEFPVIFLPFLRFDHFGHLLTETAGWLAPLLPKAKLSALPHQILLGSGAAKSAGPLADLLGWDPSQILTTAMLPTITLFPQVWLPVPTMVNRDRVDQSHSRVVRRLLRRLYGLPKRSFSRARGLSASRCGEWLYLSRSRLKVNQRRVQHEDRLEHLLSQSGWRVIHPQTLSLSNQLRHLRRASVIAGPLGSAFHLLFPFGALSNGPLVITLGFQDELSMPGPGQNFGLQFSAQQLKVLHLPLLAFADQSVDPAKAPRSLLLRFSKPVDQVAKQLLNHAESYQSALPQ